MTKTSKTAKRKAAEAKRPAKTNAASKPSGGEKKPKRLSALDAAAQVLAKAANPMRSGELIEAMAEADLWKSPGGKTPNATLYAAMIREEHDRKNASRFKKVDRGLFTTNAKKGV